MYSPLFMPMPWIASATALKPCGNLVGSGSWLPSAERLNAIQQSSLREPHSAQSAAQSVRGDSRLIQGQGQGLSARLLT